MHVTAKMDSTVVANYWHVLRGIFNIAHDFV